MKIFKFPIRELKNKVFEALSSFRFGFYSKWEREKLAFVLGLTASRFSHARFWVDGKEYLFRAEDWNQFERITRLQTAKMNLPNISDLMLARMWASRKTIVFSGNDRKLEILTYWHF